MGTVTTTWILMKKWMGGASGERHCESPWLAEKEATFLSKLLEKDDGQGSVRSFRVERRLVGCPGSP